MPSPPLTAFYRQPGLTATKTAALVKAANAALSASADGAAAVPIASAASEVVFYIEFEGGRDFDSLSAERACRLRGALLSSRRRRRPAARVVRCAARRTVASSSTTLSLPPARAPSQSARR